MIKVKICANRNTNEAQMCIDAGADIIGMLVGQKHNSDDFINKETAKQIVDYVDDRCDTAMVTHLTSSEEIIELAKFINCTMIQLHSDIEESEVEKIVQTLPDIKFIRLIHISTDGEICTNYSKMKYVDYYLLDSFNLKTDQVGGTGLTHDWNKSKEIIKKLNKPTFLAGGLTPANVKTAIEIAQPYGVDVNTGCKNEAGRKDPELVKLFVKRAKEFKSEK